MKQIFTLSLIVFLFACSSLEIRVIDSNINEEALYKHVDFLTHTTKNMVNSHKYYMREPGKAWLFVDEIIIN